MDWKKVFNPPFIAATLVLVIALAGLQSVVDAFGLFLLKKPIALRQRLFFIPTDMGPYHKAYEQNLSRELVEELGTDQYISWTYEDTRIKRGEPGSQVQLHVAYYTGTPDSTPHVPERCFVAAGAVPGKSDTVPIKLDPDPHRIYREGDRVKVLTEGGQFIDMPMFDIPAHVFDFQQPEAERNQIKEPAMATSTVVYFFACNGRFMSNPKQVSAQILDVSSRYAYWCKIEVQPRDVHDRAKAIEIARQFLTLAMPEIQACLPDWNEVQAGRYPEPEKSDQ